MREAQPPKRTILPPANREREKVSPSEHRPKPSNFLDGLRGGLLLFSMSERIYFGGLLHETKKLTNNPDVLNHLEMCYLKMSQRFNKYEEETFSHINQLEENLREQSESGERVPDRPYKRRRVHDSAK